jgi:hypothetical protein
MALSPVKDELDHSDFKPGDKLLLQLCVETLKDVHPKGATIKELANIMMQRHKDHIYLFKCSTILSTKLNAFYRRCHPDDPRHAKDSMMALCPISRVQSEEPPRRLLYRYTSIEELIAQKNARLVGIPAVKRAVDAKVVIKTSSDSEEEDFDQDDRLRRPINRLTPPAEDDDDQQDAKPSPYQLRRFIKRTPHAFNPVARRKSQQQSLQVLSPPPSLPESTSSSPTDLGKNPYYDNTVSLFSVADVGYFDYPSQDNNSTSLWMWDDTMTEDIKSPESITLDDLNNLF